MSFPTLMACCNRPVLYLVYSILSVYAPIHPYWRILETIETLQAGSAANVIPDEALIELNVRSFDEAVRQRVLAAIERIVNAEASASGATRQPEITPLDRYDLVVDDAPAWLAA